MNVLELQGLGVQLHGRLLLDDIALSLQPGEMLGLIGPNGAGKSTLLKAIAHLLPYQGEIRLGALSLARLAPRERARRLAYLGQGDTSGWPLRLRDYVALGRLPYRRSAADEPAVEAAIVRMRLEGLAARRFDQLSGGERARARLARALAVGSPLLLADEPVAALDPYHQLNVMQLLREQCAEGRSALVVLHDLTLASRFCDRLLLLDQGRLVACGSARQVLTPKHLQQVYRVQAMLGEYQQEPFVLPWACRHPEEHP